MHIFEGRSRSCPEDALPPTHLRSFHETAYNNLPTKGSKKYHLFTFIFIFYFTLNVEAKTICKYLCSLHF